MTIVGIFALRNANPIEMCTISKCGVQYMLCTVPLPGCYKVRAFNFTFEMLPPDMKAVNIEISSLC